ncbi:MAG: hypothetical protein KA386_03180 [Leptothrix sp. (in: Bacteria)]|nr:hypothetical protein [Leptothrix sp. (in: b-proteobacteria)]
MCIVHTRTPTAKPVGPTPTSASRPHPVIPAKAGIQGPCAPSSRDSWRHPAPTEIWLSLRHAGQLRDAIWCCQTQSLPAKVRLAHRLSLDEYQGRQRVQMVVEGVG